MLSLIERPLSSRQAAAAGLLLLVAGTVYCLAYTLLRGVAESPLVPLAWGLANLLPWLAAFEVAKRRAGRGVGALEPAGALAVIVAGAALFSLLLEVGLGLIALPASPEALGFQILRRLPGAGLVLFLLLLGRSLGSRRAVRADALPASLPLLARQIDWVRAAGNYLEFHSPAGLVMRRMTIKQAEAALAGEGFVRIHRSLLVNAARVACLHRGKLADEIELADGTQLRVGGAYRSQLRRLEARRAA